MTAFRPHPARTYRPAPTRSGWRQYAPLAALLLGLLFVGVLVLVFILSSKSSGSGEPTYTVQVQDEPDEGAPGAAGFVIVDEPEERTGGSSVPVKVAIQDEVEDGDSDPTPIDKTPLVKYALGTNNAPGIPPPPPTLSDERVGHVAGVVRRAPISFGLTATEAAGNARNKLLTYAANGWSNMTVVRINGALTELGSNQGRWVRLGEATLTEGIKPWPGSVSATQSTWVVGADAQGNGGLRFHQILEVVPGQAVLVEGAPRRQLDTVLIRWVIANQDRKSHTAGLRLAIDSLIGTNDGAPFTVPGQPGLINTSADFRQPQDVPDFVQALEVPNLLNPGTIAHLTAKVGGKIEPPDRLSLTHYPEALASIENACAVWDFPIQDMRDDSAIVLYWSDKEVPAGSQRVIGFGYGLGQIVSTGKLGVTLGGSFDLNQNFTVTAYVEKPVPGQTVRLELPDGLRLVEGAETQAVPRALVGDTSLVTWKVQGKRAGTVRLTVRSSTGQTQARTLTIAGPHGQGGVQESGPFAVDLTGAFDPGKAFQVIAKVAAPAPGQTLTLQLPPGLNRVEGPAVQKVPAADKEAQVLWGVRVLNTGKFAVRVASSTGGTVTKLLTIAQPGLPDANFNFGLKGNFAPGQSFTVNAAVSNPVPNQTLTLQLPAGLQRVVGEESQRVPPPPAGDVSWDVKILQQGKFPVRVASSTGLIQKKTLVIAPGGDQAGQFTFEFSGDIRPGKDFEVSARVTQPVAGQTLTLVLPPELKLSAGQSQQPVPATAGAPATVVWRVQVVSAGRLPVRVESSTGLVRTKIITLSENPKSAPASP
jgi:predicted secreted protein